MENFIVFAVFNFDDLLESLVDLELGVKPLRAGSQDTSMSWKLSTINFQYDITESSLLALQSKQVHR